MKEKIKTNFTSLFKSMFDNKILFERRNNSLFFPFLILILAISMMVLPPFILSKNLDEEEITTKFPQISAPIEKLLTSSLDCTVTNGSLVCSEDAAEINTVVGEDIKYTVIANPKSFATSGKILPTTS